MLGNALMTVRNCAENDALALAFYLYQMTVDITALDASEECQTLYEALVDRLNLGNHVDAILNALLYRLERSRQLTPISEKERYKHPLYKKTVKKTHKFKAHDEGNVCGVGDKVLIVETRKLSKDKNWRVAEIVEKAK